MPDLVGSLKVSFFLTSKNSVSIFKCNYGGTEFYMGLKKGSVFRINKRFEGVPPFNLPDEVIETAKDIILRGDDK